MKTFKLISQFKPCGDQPQAIQEIKTGFEKGYRYQTLIGVTGSGKTFTMANVIAALGKPTLIISHNKTLAAQLYSEMKTFFPQNAVEQLIRPTGLLDPKVEIKPATGQVEDLLGEIRSEIRKGNRTLVTTLTKKGAENLCDYLNAEGIRVKYLHSEINTLERARIIKELREVVKKCIRWFAGFSPV